MEALDTNHLHHQSRRAFLWACMLDVMVGKPGNVSVHSAGHGMTAALFIASAKASAPAICAINSPVGDRIEAAEQATRSVAHCNTNLGILLLCAPLAAAHERLTSTFSPDALRHALGDVLTGLTVEDARATYRAIARASPGGLGEAPEQDVAQAPTVDLRSAMRLAAMRDTIARQYANGFADLFELGLPAFRKALRFHGTDQASRERGVEHAVLQTYLAWLSRFPDAHIVRKHGLEIAQSVTEQARDLKKRCNDGNGPDAHHLANWDLSLKRKGINPGTSADLTVATAMLAALLDGGLCDIQPTPGVEAAGLAWKVLGKE
jgi:triphosphoribosyl-dephospho-CoA synthase